MMMIQYALITAIGLALFTSGVVSFFRTRSKRPGWIWVRYTEATAGLIIAVIASALVFHLTPIRPCIPPVSALVSMVLPLETILLLSVIYSYKVRGC